MSDTYDLDEKIPQDNEEDDLGYKITYKIIDVAVRHSQAELDDQEHSLQMKLKIVDVVDDEDPYYLKV